MSTRVCVYLSVYLKQQLVLGDPLDWFDEVGGDGVSQSASLLNVLFMHTRRQSYSNSLNKIK